MRRSQVVQYFAIGVFLTLAVSPFSILGHGGEDHGDAKPKSAASTKGTVSHSVRSGEVELMLKHPVLVPDQTTDAQLFITSFATNEPLKGATAKIEIEGDKGHIFPAAVQSSEQIGVFKVQLPALPEGDYKVRMNVSYGNDTDTTTITGVEVKHAAAADAEVASWSATAMIGAVFATVFLLLASLLYVVWRFVTSQRVDDGALPA